MSLNLREIEKRLLAKAELDSRSPLTSDAARYLIRMLAPEIAALVREEVAKERRRLAGSEKQA